MPNRKAGRPRKRRVTVTPCPIGGVDVTSSRQDPMRGLTAAQKALCITEPAYEIDPVTGRDMNPNGVKRRRRYSAISHMHRRGLITDREHTAALAIQDAYEATEKRPPAIKEIDVDSSPKPDANIAIQIDRVSRLVNVTKALRGRYRRVVDHVVVRNLPIRRMNTHSDDRLVQMRYLKLALNQVADTIGC